MLYKINNHILAKPDQKNEKPRHVVQINGINLFQTDYAYFNGKVTVAPLIKFCIFLVRIYLTQIHYTKNRITITTNSITIIYFSFLALENKSDYSLMKAESRTVI